MQGQRQRKASTRVLLLPQLVCDQHLLPDEATTPGVLASSTLETLEPAWHDHHQAHKPQARASYPHLSHHRLWHRPLSCMLQDPPDTKDTSPRQASRESHQHHQDATRSKDRGICKDLRRSHLHKKSSKYSIRHLDPPTRVHSYISTSHLRKEDLPELWLVRCKVRRDDPRHRSKTGGPCWI